jgi:hypothetical protein
MSDQIDAYRAMNEHRRDEGAERREQAAADYWQAAESAAAVGLRLCQVSEAHYQLSSPGWLINVYPGNCRLFRDPGRGRAPFLRVSSPWTLGDVVAAAIDAMGGKA